MDKESTKWLKYKQEGIMKENLLRKAAKCFLKHEFKMLAVTSSQRNKINSDSKGSNPRPVVGHEPYAAARGFVRMRTSITNCFLFQWDALSPLHCDDYDVTVIIALVASLRWKETAFFYKICQTKKNSFPSV